jgi:hypothetical protein
MDSPFLNLSSKWRIAYDRRQWVVQRASGRDWVAFTFISSTKATLLRVLREAGAVIDADGQAGIDAMPDTFAAWEGRNKHGSQRQVGPEPRPGSP